MGPLPRRLDSGRIRFSPGGSSPRLAPGGGLVLEALPARTPVSAPDDPSGLSAGEEPRSFRLGRPDSATHPPFDAPPLGGGADRTDCRRQPDSRRSGRHGPPDGTRLPPLRVQPAPHAPPTIVDLLLVPCAPAHL